MPKPGYVVAILLALCLSGIAYVMYNITLAPRNAGECAAGDLVLTYDAQRTNQRYVNRVQIWRSGMVEHGSEAVFEARIVGCEWDSHERAWLLEENSRISYFSRQEDWMRTGWIEFGTYQRISDAYCTKGLLPEPIPPDKIRNWAVELMRKRFLDATGNACLH